MIKISNGKIRLEDKLFDLTTFQMRPKVTDRDLENYYEEFIGHVGEIKDYFEDKDSFEKSVDEAANSKRPKLISRGLKYPFLWGLRESYMPFAFLDPSKRRLNDKYFMTAHCIAKIPIKTKLVIGEKVDSLDNVFLKEIEEKVGRYEDYEGIIEIPDDGTPAQAKSTSFHEALHYVIARYQSKNGRRLIDVLGKRDLNSVDEYGAERLLNERVVEIFTDKLLEHDKGAQFENRWLDYSSNDGFKHVVGGLSAMSLGSLAYISFSQPYLLPLVLVPGRIRDYLLNKHKNSRREEILKPREYPQFKI